MGLATIWFYLPVKNLNPDLIMTHKKENYLHKISQPNKGGLVSGLQNEYNGFRLPIRKLLPMCAMRGQAPP